MKKHEQVGREIVEFLRANRTWTLIAPDTPGERFVVCGTSGSGKTRAVELANHDLPPEHQIAESNDMLLEKSPQVALGILKDLTLAYEGCRHVGFNVVSNAIATGLESQGVKVFWLDSGSTAPHWRLTG
jgi:hypothetical protein